MIAKGLTILHRDQRRSTRDLRRFDISYRIIDWSVIRRRCQSILTKGVAACVHARGTGKRNRTTASVSSNDAVLVIQAITNDAAFRHSAYGLYSGYFRLHRKPPLVSDDVEPASKLPPSKGRNGFTVTKCGPQAENIGSRQPDQRDEDDQRRYVRAHSMLEIIGTVFLKIQIVS
jgi:hypothetical protein